MKTDDEERKKKKLKVKQNKGIFFLYNQTCFFSWLQPEYQWPTDINRSSDCLTYFLLFLMQTFLSLPLSLPPSSALSLSLPLFSSLFPTLSLSLSHFLYLFSLFLFISLSYFLQLCRLSLPLFPPSLSHSSSLSLSLSLSLTWIHTEKVPAFNKTRARYHISFFEYSVPYTI